MGKGNSRQKARQEAKPHELIQGWKGHPQFKAIAKLAVELHKRGEPAAEIGKALEAKFGAPSDVAHLRDEPLPFRIYGEVGTDIEGSAVEQLRLAMRLPIARQGALMPDAHVGYALPIGGVFAAHRAVSPAMVGVDIGCRMHLTIFGDTREECLRRRSVLLTDLKAVTVFGTGAERSRPADHPVLDDPRWRGTSFMRNLQVKAAQQLGTSGSGNHFAELVVGELIDAYDSDDVADGIADEVARFGGQCPKHFWGLLTHSGSRRAGHEIARHYMDLAARETKTVAQVPRYYEWLSIDGEAGQEYWDAMDLAGAYAKANHDLIHAVFARRINLKPLLAVQNHHNFAWQQGDLVVHRKGATPAEKGVLGVIPGSMGTNSYVAMGRGEPASLCSASHGAGRRGSRSASRNSISLHEVKNWLKERDIVVDGLSVDESPQAYKDIERVMSLQSDLVRPMARMRPVAVIMAGDRGDE